MELSAVVLACYGLLIAQAFHFKRGGVNSALTDKDSVNCLKGVAALLVVFSHAHYYAAELGLLRILKPFGYIGVSLFFFCSGYGVMKQYRSDAAYLDGFLKKRFTSVYWPYFAAVVLWLIFGVLFENDGIDGKNLLVLLLKNGMLVRSTLPFAWYVLAVLVWYVVFWCAAAILKRPDRIFAAVVAVNILWYIIGMTTNISAFYYNGTCCITLGCFIAWKEAELPAPKRSTLLLSGAAFGASVLFLYLFGEKSGMLYSLSIIMSSLSFVWLMYTGGFWFSFHSRCTRQLGRYSYEIYLTQGIAYSLTRQLTGGECRLFWAVFAVSLFLTAGLTKKMGKLFQKSFG